MAAHAQPRKESVAAAALTSGVCLSPTFIADAAAKAAPAVVSGWRYQANLASFLRIPQRGMDQRATIRLLEA